MADDTLQVVVPFYTDRYPANLECDWKIVAQENSVITLKVYFFSVDYFLFTNVVLTL